MATFLAEQRINAFTKHTFATNVPRYPTLQLILAYHLNSLIKKTVIDGMKGLSPTFTPTLSLGRERIDKLVPREFDKGGKGFRVKLFINEDEAKTVARTQEAEFNAVTGYDHLLFETKRLPWGIELQGVDLLEAANSPIGTETKLQSGLSAAMQALLRGLNTQIWCVGGGTDFNGLQDVIKPVEDEAGWATKTYGGKDQKAEASLRNHIDETDYTAVTEADARAMIEGVKKMLYLDMAEVPQVMACGSGAFAGLSAAAAWSGTQWQPSTDASLKIIAGAVIRIGDVFAYYDPYIDKINAEYAYVLNLNYLGYGSKYGANKLVSVLYDIKRDEVAKQAHGTRGYSYEIAGNLICVQPNSNGWFKHLAVS